MKLLRFVPKLILDDYYFHIYLIFAIFLAKARKITYILASNKKEKLVFFKSNKNIQRQSVVHTTKRGNTKTCKM